MKNNEKFNQKEYINDWKKKNRVQWKVDLPIEEKEKYDKILSEKGLSRRDFLKLAFDKLFINKID